MTWAMTWTTGHAGNSASNDTNKGDSRDASGEGGGLLVEDVAAEAAAAAATTEAAVAAYCRGCLLFIVKIFLCGIFVCGGNL